jgi:hypothetical protein
MLQGANPCPRQPKGWYMKLKLQGINWTHDSIEFRVPHEIMERAEWSGGEAEVDLSTISNIVDVRNSIKPKCHCNPHDLVYRGHDKDCPEHIAI